MSSSGNKGDRGGRGDDRGHRGGANGRASSENPVGHLFKVGLIGEEVENSDGTFTLSEVQLKRAKDFLEQVEKTKLLPADKEFFRKRFSRDKVPFVPFILDQEGDVKILVINNTNGKDRKIEVRVGSMAEFFYPNDTDAHYNR